MWLASFKELASVVNLKNACKTHGRNSQTWGHHPFIDEIHEIVGAGSAGDGNMDAGNILKPALARGELQLVGATTLNEYRIIEKMQP